MSLPLVLGGIPLFSFDAPEQFGPIGGKQIAVKHEFPGGITTQQEIGGFPEPIKWKGTLTGAGAMAALQALDQIRVSGQDTTLSWGPFAWTGKLTNFAGHAKHAFLIPYEATFDPTQDLGAGVTPLAGPASYAQDDIDLGTSTGAIVGLMDGTATGGLAFPDALAGPANALLTAVSTGLANGNNTVNGLLSADVIAIAAAAAAAQAAALPIMDASGGTPDAYVAAEFWARAGNIASIIPSIKKAIAQITVVNPNLFAVAAQYYGDATLWEGIAEANGLVDPQPRGIFTLSIPASG